MNPLLIVTAAETACLATHPWQQPMTRQLKH